MISLASSAKIVSTRSVETTVKRSRFNHKEAMALNGEMNGDRERDRQETRQIPASEMVLGVWRRRKWLAIPLFAGVLTAAVSIVMFLPDVYRSTATILVERQKVPEAFVQSTITSGIDSRLQTITQQILSRSQLSSLIDRFNLYPEMRQGVSLEKVIERMREDIQLGQKGLQKKRGRDDTTTTFTISYRGSDPQVVVQVTNTLAAFYIEENFKAREQQAAGTAEFLRVQLKKVQKKLGDQERQVSQFKERYMGELPEQLEANLAALENLNTQLRLNSEKQTQASEQRAALEQRLADVQGLGPSAEPLATATSETDAVRLERMQRELRVLRTRFSDKYPDIVQLKSEIVTLEQHLAKMENGTEPDKPMAPPPNPYVLRMQEGLSTLGAEIKALRSQERSLLRSIDLYQKRVENTPRRELEIYVLSRDYETTNELYKSLLKRLEEAELAESLEQRQQGERFRILEPATPSEQPSEPNRRKLALIGLMLSLGLAVGVMVVAEQLDTSFHTVDDLRAFSQTPVLVNLPRIITTAEFRRRRWRYGLGAVSGVVGLAIIVGSLYVALKGRAELAELLAQLQRLRQ